MYLQKLLKLISYVFFIMLIVSYAGYKLYPLIVGPEIVIHKPSIGQNIDGNLVEISGLVLRAKNLKLFDREVAVNQKGEFSEVVAKQKNYTDIVLSATDRFDRVTTKRLWVK
jgi:hypothetical protein